jgi:3',5'-cyclic AMP phosphodiesterase CpdA
MKIKLLLLVLLFIYQARAQEELPTKIAFLADVHFQDLFGTLEDTEFRGILNPGSNKYTLLRTMDSQLHSTRIFNENYFALLAALDDIVKRKIKLVALPGDYTDDGQPIHLRGLRTILNHYSQNYSIQFFITTGNHDPSGPIALDAGKNDFLGEHGKRQPVFSKDSLYNNNSDLEYPVVVSRDIAKMGYVGVMEAMMEFGFFPNENNFYWETPFSEYNPDTYDYDKALESSHIEKRTYLLKDSLLIPDASYLVEPVKGLWLLAIDGNTYVPQENGQLSGAGMGYNNAIIYKPHLFTWLKKVVEASKKYNKKLVAFSHYPAVDFNEDTSGELRALFGEDKWQLERVPEEQIAKTMADAGIKLHFAGHMHINDTGKRSYDNNSFIVNIQTPSLAAYIPGYKILSVGHNTAEIETIVIDEVPRFNELFPIYHMEYNFLKESGQPVWDNAILQSKSYHEFMGSHLENLVKLRFLDDWSSDFHEFLSGLSGKEIFILSQNQSIPEPLDSLKNGRELSEIEVRFENLEDYESWAGEDMILDFYKIRNADKLAFRDIPQMRLDQYRIILEAFQRNSHLKDAEIEYAHDLNLFMSIFGSFMKGLPASHFKINLQTGEITDLEKY